MVKTLNIPFEDEEFKRIVLAKDLSSKGSWKKWILSLIEKSDQDNSHDKNFMVGVENEL